MVNIAVPWSYVCKIFSRCSEKKTIYPSRPARKGRREENICGIPFVTEMAELLTQLKEATMKKNYRFGNLSKDEKEFHEMILLEEIEIQSWYAVTYSTIFAEEIILTVQ
jgi:hypothetical protein